MTRENILKAIKDAESTGRKQIEEARAKRSKIILKARMDAEHLKVTTEKEIALTEKETFTKAQKDIEAESTERIEKNRKEITAIMSRAKSNQKTATEYVLDQFWRSVDA